MSDVIRWGILAPGKIAHKFALGLQSVPEAKLHAIASRDKEKAEDFADQYGAPVSYGSYGELAADPQVDVIYIATPHTFHMENTLLCLNNGKGVLCEKPLAINASQVRKMLASAQQNQCFLMEALWTRFLPSMEKTAELIAGGAIGAVQELQADFGFKAHYEPASRLFDPHLGGGALLDIGIYPLFFAQFLFGKPAKVQARAILAPTGVDESCQVDLHYPGGQKAQLQFTLKEDTPIEALILGDRGKITLPNRWYHPVNLFLDQDNSPREIEIDYQGNGYNYQAIEVMECIRSGRIQSSRWSHDFSLQLMELMDEIRRQCGIKYPMDEVI